MTKLTSMFLALALVAGCKGKQSKQGSGSGSAAVGSGSAMPASAPDPKYVERLPTVGAGDVAVMLHYASAVVRLAADGSVDVATPPTAAAADPRTPSDPFTSARRVPVAGLGAALGLPPVVQRTDSAFGPIESGSAAGSGSSAAASEVNINDVAFARLGHPVAASGAPKPATRLTSAFALAHPNDVSGGVIVFADAAAPAAALVDTLTQTGGFLAVRRGTQLGALPIALDRHAPAPTSPDRAWVEVTLDGAITVSAIPGAPVTVASIDKLPDAIKTFGTSAVDVLVGPGAKVQDLVAAVEQLRAANVIAIGLGRAPAQADAAARQAPGPRITAWDFYMHDVDKTAVQPFRDALDAAYAPMLTCYREALAKSADLAGTAQLELIVAANAKVSAADAQGAPKDLTKCVVNAVRGAKFPQPSSAGAKITAKVAFAPR